MRGEDPASNVLRVLYKKNRPMNAINVTDFLKGSIPKVDSVFQE